MVIRCVICETTFSKKANYDRHLQTSKHKKREANVLLHQCSYCNKYFSSKKTLNAHSCLPSSSTHISKVELKNTRLEIELQETKREVDVLRKQIEMLLEKNGGNTTHNTTTNSNNTIDNGTHFNITVNSFGNENIDYLTDKIVCRLIQTAPFASVPQLIEKIHFDPDHPENHNIKITNKKMNYAEIIKNNKWVTANKKQVIDNVIQNSYYLLDEKFIDNKDTMTQKRQERFENFQEKFQEEDEEIMKNIKNQVDLILINGTNNVHK